ncbi:uncharacterized protein PAC_04454 [Phialocephala subalpina]|uniref:N-acetyltransferase domain-containing protein n=1 Tax=Phialocephala subalpina TaxID=576137 RepID=A0A1L7WP70_9HELO|nr:uncharacterized protein PAC_04454 [Phialocephala subalpina]
MSGNADVSKYDGPKFHIRYAGVALNDEQFIVEAFDSTLSYLVSIGSGEMWGSTPFSEKDGFLEETLKDVEQSEKYQTTGSGDAVRILIAEIELSELSTSETRGNLRFRIDNNKQRFLSVGTATIRENWLPAYVTSKAEHLGLGGIELRDVLYLEVIITDYRTGSTSKGAGMALIQSIVKYGRKAGKRTLYVDAWAGNERKLVRYYEHQGFNVVGDFSMKRRSGSTWLGTLLQMDLRPEND